MKMKRRNLFITIVVVAALMVGALGWFISTSNYSVALYANWKLYLPFLRGCQEVTSVSMPSFHGDGSRYHSFKYIDEEKIETAFSWTDGEHSGIYRSGLGEEVEYLLDELGVSADVRPDYGNCVYWYTSDDHDELIILWDSSSDMIYS